MKQKRLSELILLDKFLFDETMDDPEAHEAALQIIFGQENLKLLESVRSLMVNMEMTADGAMDILQISDPTREVLRSRLVDAVDGNR